MGFREGGFSYHAIGARVQWKRSTVMRVWKQWTDEHRITRKTDSGRRKAVGSTLVHCCRCTNAGFVNSSMSAAPWIACKGALIQDPLTANPRLLRLQWAHEHRAWQADWHQVVFSDESHFNLWDHEGRIRVRRYTGERCLPECVIERHRGLTPGVMIWGVISYHGRSNLLRIEGVPGAIFQQYNARPHVAKSVRDFCSAQHMQLLPWPAYSPHMSPIEHVWDLIGRCLARDPRPAASKDELLLRIPAAWNSLP
ncbi:transposable element Tc1 transposase [Trichonephila clavipes]|nr:transposable element Tc1 transposase [Trichonephila clavipes]